MACHDHDVKIRTNQEGRQIKNKIGKRKEKKGGKQLRHFWRAFRKIIDDRTIRVL